METVLGGKDEDQSVSLANRRLHALLDRHNVRKHRRVTVLSEILGVAYQTVYRRMPSGDWPLEELDRVAAHFGETLTQLLDPASEPAVLVDGGRRLPCRVEVGGLADPSNPGSLIAVEAERGWVVMLATDSIAAQARDVLSLTIQSRAKEANRVAVLDDAPDVAASICSDLKDMGFEAEPFYTIESLLAAIEAKGFDAYIIDWVVGQATTRSLINAIRQADPNCPIAILTGQLEEGGLANEAEIGLVSAGENMQFYTKPLPIQIIGQRLKKALGVRAGAQGRDAR